MRPGRAHIPIGRETLVARDLANLEGTAKPEGLCE